MMRAGERAAAAARADQPRVPGPSLDEALARAGDGACVIGPDGRIVLWNRAAERIMGHAAREVMHRPCCDVFVGRDDSGNRLCYQGCHVMTLVRMGESVQSFDMQTRTRAGKPVWLNVSILALADAAGRDGALTVHLFRDVTASRELLHLVQERFAEPPAPADGESPLSRRELEVLRLLGQGLGTRAAAERLHVSPATVRNHVQHILSKLAVHSRLEAVAYAGQHRLI
jgi:PAS domain S-box-containing protein